MSEVEPKRWETWADRPKGAGALFFYWLRKLFRVGAGCRCPRCEEGKMFQSYYEIHKKCPNCSITFQPYPGDSLGVIAVGYFLTLIPTLLVVVAAFAYLDFSAYACLALYMALTAAILFGLYPNMKGIWVAFVYLLTGLRKNL